MSEQEKPLEQGSQCQDDACAPSRPAPAKKAGPMIATFIILAVVWIIFSGKFDAFHLALGVFCCGLVSYMSSDLLFERLDHGKIFAIWLRFLLYIPWLIKEIATANLWVLYVSCHPNMQRFLDPQVIRFKSTPKSRLAQVTFANSITLTPGTITVDVDFDGNYVVHALDWKSASGLPGEMQRRIAKVFGE